MTLPGQEEGQSHLTRCVAMMEPATGWFEIAEVPNARADFMANVPETTWLSQHPWPTETRMDKGGEFAGKV